MKICVTVVISRLREKKGQRYLCRIKIYQEMYQEITHSSRTCNSHPLGVKKKTDTVLCVGCVAEFKFVCSRLCCDLCACELHARLDSCLWSGSSGDALVVTFCVASSELCCCSSVGTAACYVFGISSKLHHGPCCASSLSLSAVWELRRLLLVVLCMIVGNKWYSPQDWTIIYGPQNVLCGCGSFGSQTDPFRKLYRHFLLMRQKSNFSGHVQNQFFKQVKQAHFK